jgi:hypothetical protein
MVTTFTAWLLIGLAQVRPASAYFPDDDDSSPLAAKALSKGSYPWYDAKADSIRPVQPPWTPSWLDWILDRVPSFSGGPSTGRSSGNVLVFVILVVALAALVAGLIWAYRYYMPDFDQRGPQRGRIGTAAAYAGLPHGLPADLTDPLALARELRARGDLAGAILALFVHQVITLDRLGLARLAPGRTARQLVRSVPDAWVRGRVEPTLRLFETSFYGHRTPDPKAFEAAWSLAAELEERVAAGAGAHVS